MSTALRAMPADDPSAASNPVNIKVAPLRYAKHFPFWPALFAAAFCAAALCAALKPAFWVAAAFFLALNLLFWLRLRLQFRYGSLSPAIVVAETPLTLAVYTDLARGAGEYPAIKILRHPRPQGIPVALGGKFATVALCSRRAGGVEHWQDFDPVMVECVTSDRLLIERTFYSIPDEEWRQFKNGLKNLPSPLKPGLYPVRRIQSAE